MLQVLYSSGPSPDTYPARLDLPGTVVPADLASRVIKACKPPYHNKEQHIKKSAVCEKPAKSFQRFPKIVSDPQRP